MKKNPTQRQKIAAWSKKLEKITPPETLCELLYGIEEPEKLLGIDRVTLARWKSGQSRIPLAATRLLQLIRGDLPKWYGDWSGWRFSPNGTLFPPGWGEGLHRADIVDLWTWRRRAFLADELENENNRLKRELAFYKGEMQTRQRLGFASSMIEALQER